MASRLKTTGFTRFLLMLIIVAPLAYIGASYYNGEDPLKNIRELFKGNGAKETTQTRNMEQEEQQLLREQLKTCQDKNEELNRKLGELQASLDAISKKK